MVVDLNRLAIEDRVKSSYRVSADDPDKTCQAVCIDGLPVDVNVIAGNVSIPRIVNKDYPVADVILSIAFSTNTFKILLKHRDRGKIEFSYDVGFTTFITMQKGAIYSDDGINLTGKTIYFRSPTIGTIELLEYSFA